jgi:hypothetical protein
VTPVASPKALSVDHCCVCQWLLNARAGCCSRSLNTGSAAAAALMQMPLLVPQQLRNLEADEQDRQGKKGMGRSTCYFQI